MDTIPDKLPRQLCQVHEARAACGKGLEAGKVVEMPAERQEFGE